MTVDLLLQAMSTVLFAVCMFILKDFKKDANEIKKSILQLNINFSTLMANDKNKDREIVAIKTDIVRNRDSIHDIRNEIQKAVLRLELKVQHSTKDK